MLEVNAAAQPLHDHLREVEGRVLTHQLAGAHHPVVVDHLGLHGRAGGVVLKPNNHAVSQSVSNNTSTAYCCCNSQTHPSPKPKSAQKADPGEETSPAAPAIPQTPETF